MGRIPNLLALLVSILLLATVGCSSDDNEGGDASPQTTATTSAADPDDEATTTSALADTGEALGMVAVDGEIFALTDVTGITSCNFDDPSGNFSVAAKSADGSVFVRLDSYADDPDSTEFSVAVGDIEYVSASPEDVVIELDAPTVNGTVAVEPLFEEGTAQDVVFEITCPA